MSLIQFGILLINDCFDVTAVYRIKGSGSNDVGKTNLLNIINHIQSHDNGE